MAMSIKNSGIATHLQRSNPGGYIEITAFRPAQPLE